MPLIPWKSVSRSLSRRSSVYFPRCSPPNPNNPTAPPMAKIATIHQKTIVATRCNFRAVSGDAFLSMICQTITPKTAPIRAIFMPPDPLVQHNTTPFALKKCGRGGNPFTPHQNSVTPRVDFEGAAVFAFQKAAGLDQTPATFLPTFPPRFSPHSQNGTASQK